MYISLPFVNNQFQEPTNVSIWKPRPSIRSVIKFQPTLPIGKWTLIKNIHTVCKVNLHTYVCTRTLDLKSFSTGCTFSHANLTLVCTFNKYYVQTCARNIDIKFIDKYLVSSINIDFDILNNPSLHRS